MTDVKRVEGSIQGGSQAADCSGSNSSRSESSTDTAMGFSGCVYVILCGQFRGRETKGGYRETCGWLQKSVKVDR